MGSFLSKHMSSSRFNTKTPNDRDIMDTPLQRDMVGSGGPHIEDEDPKIKTVKLDNVDVSGDKIIRYNRPSNSKEGINAFYNKRKNETKFVAGGTTVTRKGKPQSDYKEIG